MHCFFCADSEDPRRVDPDFLSEWEAALACGWTPHLLDHSAAARGEADAALAHLDPDLQGPCLYRGWMLRPEHYALLHAAWTQRGLAPLTPPRAYRTCHHLPECYSLLEGATPESVWFACGAQPDLDAIAEGLRRFGDRPLVLKDYVKSEKHDWEGACFVPQASDRAALERVIAGFLDWRGSAVEGGLVFRAFERLRAIGAHPQSGMPLTHEVRQFFLHGQRLTSSDYWELSSGKLEPPPDDLFDDLARRVPSPFFSMDVAQREDGAWIVIELGDGQVSGLPPRLSPATFYERLAQGLRGEST